MRLLPHFLAICILAGASTQAGSVGIGGGGAFFSPSINPADSNDYYVASDMSELFHSTDGGASYSLVSFQQVQGGNFAVVRFTSNPQIRYTISTIADIGTPVKSTDGGATFQTLPGNPDATETTYSINVDYQNPSRVIISYWGSVYYSTDGGNTFTLIYTAASSGAGIVVGGAFFDGNNIYLGTNDGVLFSTNGTTFQTASIGGLTPNERIFSFAGAKQGATSRFFVLTADVADVYAGVPGSDYWGFMQGIYTLDWGAASFVKKMNGINVATDFPMYVGMAENDINTAYLAGSDGSNGYPLVLKTTNAGGSWSNVFLGVGNQNITTGWCGQGGDLEWYWAETAMGFTVSPSDANQAIITDFGFIHRTTDGGASWRQAYVSQADENPAGAQTPQKKAYHGVGAEDTSCWQLHWVDQNTIIAAFSDIGMIRSVDGGSSWSFNYTGLAVNSVYRIVQSASGTIYAATSGVHDIYQSTHLDDASLDGTDADGKIVMSTDGGSTFSDMHLFNHPVFWLALDPTNANRMYASVVHSTLGGVYVSNDIQNGVSATWTLLPAPPRTEGHPASLVVLDDGKLLATYSGRRASAFTASSGLYLYDPGTGTWTDLSDPGMLYWTKDVVVDPNDPAQNRWYVGVFSGWGGPPNGLGGLYKTTDRGQSWTRIANMDRVTACTIGTANADEAYVTTEVEGLWYSSNINAATPTFSLVSSYHFRQPERVFENPFQSGDYWVTSFGNGITHLGATSGPTILTGPGPGSQNAPSVRGFDTTGMPNGQLSFNAYGTGGYGVNVWFGAIRQAGPTSDVLTGPGPGSVFGPQVKGFKTDSTPISKVNFYAYGTLRFGAGVKAGDVDGDGIEEIISAAGPGAVFGPHVRGWNYDGTKLTRINGINFFAYKTLKWGVLATGGAVDADTFDELLTGPGPGTIFGSQVRGFNYDGGSLKSIGGINFNPYTYSYGVHVNGGDLDADGMDEILTAPGPDPTAIAHIRGFNYDGGPLTALGAVDFDGMNGTNRYGATIASHDIDSDTFSELVVGTGYDPTNGTPRVRGYNYDNSTINPITTIDFLAYASTSRYGVNVSSGSI